MAKAKLGSGGRFKALAKKVGSKALAAWIGRKKYGTKRFAKLSAAGKKRGAPKKTKNLIKRINDASKLYTMKTGKKGK